MEGHKEWIKRGFDDGVFLVVGSTQPNLDGGILVHNTSLSDFSVEPNNTVIEYGDENFFRCKNCNQQD